MGMQKKPRKTDDADQEEGATYDFGDHYHCDLCDKDVTHTLRIRCAHESCKEVDICVSCFSVGAEKSNHKNDHPYRVIDILNFPVFEEDWRADEEIHLIEGLETYGPGNWEEIAEHVSTKNKQQCADHYQRVFIDSPDWPLPDMTKQFDPSRRLPIRPMQRLPKVPRPPSSTPVNSEIAGFMPGRQEFETEYENEAEQHVKDMEFTDADSQEDIQLKTAMLSVYNSILDRRKERKELVFDRALYDYKKHKTNDSRRLKEEQKLLTKLRVFARLQTSEDFNTLATEMIKEMKLRTRIAELQEYRRMGITSKAEAEEYENEKKNRISRAMKEERGASRYRPYDGSGHSSRASTPIRAPAPSLYPTTSLSTAASPIPPYHGYAPTPSTTRSATNPTATPTARDQRRAPQPLDLSGAEKVDLLTIHEQELCSNLRILPKSYLNIKDLLLKEYHMKGPLKRKAAREMIKMDVNKTGRLYDFLIEMGWIKRAT